MIKQFIAVHRQSRIAYYFENKRTAHESIKKSGGNIDEFDLWYAYSQFARKPYSSGYAEKHKAAARAYYHRNKNTLLPRGRPTGSKNKKRLGNSTEG